MSDKFPKIKKSIQDFFEDEDGSITRSKVLMIGGMVIILGMLLSDEVYAAHRTHYTHRTHSTHRTSNNKHGSHSSHSSSHSTHSDHYTHGSHSSHASHVSYTDSSNYGSTNTSTGRAWPKLADVQSFESPVSTNIATSAEAEITTLLNAISNPETGVQIPKIGDVEATIQTPPDTPKFTQNKG